MLRKFYGNPTSALLIIALVIVGGLYQFTQLPIALYPNTSKPSVSARINTGTMSAEEFKERYGEDIERALGAINDTTEVRSSFVNGSANFNIDFDWGIDSDDAKTDVVNVLVPFENQFPDNWGSFRVRFDGQFSSRFFLSLKSESMSTRDLTEVMRSSLVPTLRGIDGIADVWLVDWLERSLRVEVIPEQLIQHGVTFADISQAMWNQRYDTSLGALDLKESGSFHVTADRKITSIAELENVVVAVKNGQPLRVRDVAKVTLEQKPPDFMFKASGEKTLLVGGYAKPDANIKQVAEDFITLVETRAQEITDDIEVSVIMNPASFINEAVENIIQAVIVGMLIATLIVFLFLRSLRSTLVICISIPLSLVGGFVLMYLLGIELNLISLGAMALAVGMVVDGSIVVLENIVRHIEDKQPQTFEERLDTTIKAVFEVRNAVIASLLTTIIVFAPLPFTSPLASAILGDLAVVMVCVLSVSVIVTLLFIPPLTIFFQSGTARDGDHSRGVYALSVVFGRYVRRLHGLYLSGLAGLLRSRVAKIALTAGIALALLTSAALLLRVDREVMAKPATDKLFVFIDVQDKSIQIEEREELVAIYEKKLLAEFDGKLTHTLSQITDSESWVLLFLKNKRDIQEVKEAVEEYLKNTPYVRFYIDDWAPTSLEIPVPALLKIDVSGRTEDQRRETLESISQILEKRDEIGRTTIRPSVSKDDFLRVSVDQQRMARMQTSSKYRLNEDSIMQMVSGLLNTQPVYEVDFEGQNFDLILSLPEDYFNSPDQLENQLIRVGDQAIPLKAVADIRHERQWSEFYHEDAESESYVEAKLKQNYRDQRKELAAEIKAEILADPKVDSSRLMFEDTETEVNDNIKSLVVALVLALALIWVVITLQFGRMSQTAIVMLAVPMGFIGVGLSLWTLGSTLSVNSMLGLILLCGTAVNNSILFLDFFDRIKTDQPNLSVADALLETARLRFRPILITTMTTVLGMIPIAIGWGSGGEILQPLGIAICGGLWISTVLTIFAVPLAVVGADRIRTMLGKVHWLKRLGQTASLVLILFASQVWTDPAAAQLQLSLDDAIEKTIATQAELNVSKSRERRSDFATRSIYAELMPTVKVGRSYFEESTDFKEGHPSGQTGTQTDKFAQNYLRVEETIPNPYKFYNRVKINNTELEIAKSRVVDKRNELIARVRRAYFSAKVAQQSLDNANQNLKAARNNLATTRKRFQGGFVHSSDLKRSEFAFKGVEATLAQVTEIFRNELTKLRDLIGTNLNADVVLSTPIPETFKYFDLSEAQIKEILAAAEPQNIKQLELTRQSENLRYRNALADFFPELTLSATYIRKDPRDRTAEFQDPAGPTYLLTAEWELFSGGSSYYDSKTKHALRYEAEENLRQARRDYNEAITRQLKLLETLKRRFAIQRENVNITLEIVEASRDRFRSGTVDSAQVNDDFRDYLRQQDSLLDLSLEIVEATAELARLTARPDLFEKFI